MYQFNLIKNINRYFFYNMLNTQDKPEQVQDLYRTICKFNFYRDLDSLHHPLKANPELDQLPRNKSEQFQNVPLSFSSAQNYIAFWIPLFIEQLKCYIASARTTESEVPQKFDLLSYFELGSFKVMEFKRIKATGANYPTNNLILLSPEKVLGEDKDHPHLVGITYKNDGTLFVRVILGEGATSEGTAAWTTFTTTKQWYLQKICTLSSIERQFKALSNFGKIDISLRQTLLKPQEANLNTSKMFIIPNTLDNSLKKMYNETQYAAVVSSLKQEGVTLVQGPPGTGKTKTVLGTLSVLLQSSTNKEQDQEMPLLLRWKTSEQNLKHNIYDLNPWFKQGYQDWRDQPFLEDQFQDLLLTKTYQVAQRKIAVVGHKQQVTAPTRVLVCGPSNASVDEVIRKLIKQKILDGNAKSYLPKFVRIGENYHEQVQEYSLDNMAIQQQKVDKTDLQTVKKKILKQSRLVFTTLSSAGSGILQNSELQFDTVVIDEAGQAIEISSLIPLIYGAKRLILIGDPKQLPATVFSPVCLQHHYDQSLFQRLMKSKYPVNMLRVQYRMHPEISRVIGNAFYNGMLEDGQSMHTQPKGVPRPFMLLHIETSSQIFGQQSYYNPIEGECVKILVNWLHKKYKDIGVLSPYSAQVKWLNTQKLGTKCEIKTIDSFQGREKEVIVFSAVRAQRIGNDKKPNPKKTIGFVGDGRRLNVALSRAKQACIIVGDLQRLQLNKIWRSIILQARKRGNAYKVVCVQQLRQIGQSLNSLRKY